MCHLLFRLWSRYIAPLSAEPKDANFMDERTSIFEIIKKKNQNRRHNPRQNLFVSCFSSFKYLSRISWVILLKMTMQTINNEQNCKSSFWLQFWVWVWWNECGKCNAIYIGNWVFEFAICNWHNSQNQKISTELTKEWWKCKRKFKWH